MKRRTVLAVLAVCGMAALASCGSTERTRYRMTVEVETPAGVKSGSAVREVAYSVPATLPSLGESKPQWRVRGEAVAVELHGGQTLFALLKGEQGDGGFGGWGVWWLLRQHRPAPVVELWPSPVLSGTPRVTDTRPMLVRFRDMADPMSVEQVDPDDLAAAFGKGVKLKRITVELTADAVTRGIEKRLGWLARTRGALVHIPVSEYPPTGTPLPLYATLTELDFQQGAN